MNNYFRNQLSEEELRRQQPQQEEQRPHQPPIHHSRRLSAQHGEPASPASESAIVGGDSLDDIIRDNANTLHRRRSNAQPYAIEFGSPDDAFRNYQFSNEGLQVSTSFPTISSTSYADQPMLSLSPASAFSPLSSDIMSNNIASSNLSFSTPVGLYGGPSTISNQFEQAGQDPVSSNFAPLRIDGGSVRSSVVDGADTDMISVPSNFMTSDSVSLEQEQAPDPMTSSALAIDPNIATGFPPGVSRETSMAASSYPSPATGSGKPPAPSLSAGTSVPAGPVAPPPDKTIYSKSGFDMLRAFWYVGTRKNPSINLGAVDMSCSFVVSDVTMNDCPIIYVSDNFQNLTGYSRHEIMGKNCRFLQSPDAKVEAGSKREFVDNGAVYNLKQRIAAGEEVQQSLINYRKGGKPFLNLLTMIPIPWDTAEIRYFIGFQIDLVECPDAISAPQGSGGFKVDYKHSDIGQYIWTPPANTNWEPEKTLSVDDVSTLLQRYNPTGTPSDWHRQSWDKMLLENADDVVHVLSLKGLFLYLSPSCKTVLEYDTKELVGNSLSSVCHPSDIVPVTRELKETTAESPVNIVFRIRRKERGYTWFESHGSLFAEPGKGRKCIILVGRKRPVFALSRRDLDGNGGIGDSELWTKLSASGMFLYVSSTVRSLLDLQAEELVGTSIQDLMRRESRGEFGRAIEKARHGKIVSCRHEVHNRRGQVLQAQTFLYPGDAEEGQKPTFLLAQTKLVKASSRSARQAAQAQAQKNAEDAKTLGTDSTISEASHNAPESSTLTLGNQDVQLASDDNIFDELKTTRCTSWQYELRQMEKMNRALAEELAGLISSKKKRKRRKGSGNIARDCANCHTRNTPEWRRGPSGNRDLCNSCGLRWAKQTGRVSDRNSSRGGNGDTQSKLSNSPIHSSPLLREVSQGPPENPDGNGNINGHGMGCGNKSGTLNSHGNCTVQGSSTTTTSYLAGDNAISMVMSPITEERETPI